MGRIPPLIAGLILSFYWLRVLRLVRKIRRQTGRSAAFRPREPLGMALRLAWYPAVALWIALPYVAAFIPDTRLPGALRPLYYRNWIAWPAVVLAVAALAGTLVCWKRMGKSWRMGINPDEKTQLVITGPYAYVRHPIYALSSLLMLTTMAILPSPVMLAVGVVHLALLQWEARREENYLAQTHGEVYVEYCRRVGGFVPRSPKAYHGAPSRV